MIFRAFNPIKADYHAHVREVRKQYTEKFEKASSIASFPSEWIVGEVTREAALSLCNRAIKLIELGRDAYYAWPHSKNSGYYGQISCWINVIAYLNSDDTRRKSSGQFGGINNPFLAGNAILIS